MVEFVQCQVDMVRREMESRMENNRHKVLDIVGANEMKVGEAEDRIKLLDLALENLKVVENNHNINLENKIENLGYKVDNFTVDSDKEKFLNHISSSYSESNF